MFTVRYYENHRGKIPFQEWVETLSEKVQLKIDSRLDRVEQGNFGDHKPVREGIWELKIDFGAGYRIYYGKIGQQVILLLAGGDKSTQKADINKAIEFFEDYKERNKNG